MLHCDSCEITVNVFVTIILKIYFLKNIKKKLKEYKL